jgi:hypothetical protein
MAHGSFSCWISKAANTDSEYVILIAFPLPVVTFCEVDEKKLNSARGLIKCIKFIKCIKGKGKGKGKAVLLQAWSGPEGSRNLRFPDFMTTAQDDGKVVSLTHRPPLPPGNTPGTHFC